MMPNIQKLAEARQDGNMIGYVFDVIVVYLMFGLVGRCVLALVNVFQRPASYKSEVEQRALQMMKNRVALMRILAERPAYLQPGTYDDLMG